MQNRQTANQNRVVDHNHANSVFCTTLSTLESLKTMKQTGASMGFRDKLFSYYDKVDYSGKNLLELQSQLQMHLVIFRGIIITYLQDYHQAWTLPFDFNAEKTSAFILEAKSLFEHQSDQISFRLTMDLISLIQGNTTNLFIDHVNLKPSYSVADQATHRNNLFVHAARAEEMMHEQRKRVEGLQSTSELRVNLNPFYGKNKSFKYLSVHKNDYEQYYANNANFSVDLIDPQTLINTKQDAFGYYNSLKGSIKRNMALLELQICQGTVLRVNRLC